MMDRTPLLLFPGHLCDERLWNHQVTDLADVADARVLVFRRQDSFAAMASEMLADAPARFAVAGHSMGGYLAFELMRRAPERVTKLALLDTTARADPPERRQGG
jgi:pimeloyl-ACP methyl ester carboxylesterase